MPFTGFKGTYFHGLDSKNRLFIPAKYREPLGNSFVLIRAPLPDIAVFAYPTATWEELCNELNEKNAQGNLTVEQEWQRRNLYRYSEDVTMDNQGRITISPQLCEYAHLSGEVMILGNMKRLEFWNENTFNSIETTRLEGKAVGTPKLNY